MSKLIYSLIFFIVMMSCSAYGSSDFGCKVLLCLASPKDPKQFRECHHTINKLIKHLSKGKSFPRCKKKSADKKIVGEDPDAPYYPCIEEYFMEEIPNETGEGTEPTIFVCRKIIGYTEGDDPSPIYSEYTATKQTKFETAEGYEPYYPCNDGSYPTKSSKEVGKDDEHEVIIYVCYSRGREYPAKKREKPFWVQVLVEGEPQGDKFWYKKR